MPKETKRPANRPPIEVKAADILRAFRETYEAKRVVENRHAEVARKLGVSVSTLYAKIELHALADKLSSMRERARRNGVPLRSKQYDKEGVTRSIREDMRKTKGADVSTEVIGSALGVRPEKVQALRVALAKLVAAGEILRVRPGVFRDAP